MKNLNKLKKIIKTIVTALIDVNDVAITITTEYKGKGSVDEIVKDKEKILHIVIGGDIKLDKLSDSILFHIANKYGYKFSMLKKMFKELSDGQD